MIDELYGETECSICCSGGGLESDLPDSDSVLRIIFRTDSDAGTDSDSGVDSEFNLGADSGIGIGAEIGINLRIAICPSNEIKIDFRLRNPELAPG